MNGELIVAYLDALHAMLDDAIEVGDTETIAAIKAFADVNSYPSLKAEAESASG